MQPFHQRAHWTVDNFEYISPKQHVFKIVNSSKTQTMQELQNTYKNYLHFDGYHAEAEKFFETYTKSETTRNLEYQRHILYY